MMTKPQCPQHILNVNKLIGRFCIYPLITFHRVPPAPDVVRMEVMKHNENGSHSIENYNCQSFPHLPSRASPEILSVTCRERVD